MTLEIDKIPEWALKERERDLAWIRENLDIFWPLAKDVYDEAGRGVIMVVTTQQPTGEGYPFGYVPQGVVNLGDDEDTKRIVREYDPEKELVVLLVKSGDRTSTYRVRPLTGYHVG